MDKDLLTKLIDHLAYNRPMRREKVIERLKEIVSSRATRELDLYQPLKVDLNEQGESLSLYQISSNNPQEGSSNKTFY